VLGEAAQGANTHHPSIYGREEQGSPGFEVQKAVDRDAGEEAQEREGMQNLYSRSY